MTNWKSIYRQELEAPDARGRIEAWFRAERDGRLDAGLARGAIPSFPHTALGYAGPLQAQVVSALYRQKVERIIALGVLHSSGQPDFRCALDETEPAETRRQAFDRISGGFLLEQAGLSTPFGPVPTWRPAEETDLVRVDRTGRLAGEFSLDTFAAILRLGASVSERPVIPLLPLWIGMTRHPIERDFSVARRLADWLAHHLTPGTAVVTTGDLVHYGATYGSPDDDCESPDLLTGRFRDTVDDMLQDALRDGNLADAWDRSWHVLKNDQREVLPVVAYLLGTGARHDILSFDLSDYSQILAVAPPCLVCSSLLIYG